MGAIYLVRHGKASFGSDDYDVLSATGAEQARLTGAELRRRGVTITTAYCGTLARQRDSAAAALAELAPSAVVKEDPRWNEYEEPFHFLSDHTGGARPDPANPRAYQAALEEGLAAWIAAGEDGPGGGAHETWPGFLGRVTDALTDVVAALGKGEQAVVFTSGGVIGTLCGVLLGDPVSGLLVLHRVTINGGITKIVTGRSGTSLLSFNEHGHFEGDAAGLLSFR